MAKLNVLVVDDDKLFLDTIGDWIKSWGHTTAVASSGQEAIDAVKNNKFDVIILDYIMPEMDGVAALKEIRKIDSKVAVIMFTGYPDERSVSEGCKLGISSYIPKLNDVVNVHSVLEAALDLIEKKLSQ
ncbi:MAG: response regulator [Candidatus Omnitrophota bacterium]|nr:response regulator [Candidatus Omnitrophota bacterium]